MITLEQVEKLRQYADISYAEAKEALENAGGDILQALIDLERQGKIPSPKGGGAYVTTALTLEDFAGSEKADDPFNEEKGTYREGSFGQTVNRIFQWVCGVIHRGNINSFLVTKHGEQMMRLPVTALVLLLIFAFWVVLPLLVIGLFFGFRYSFQGPDLGRDTVNDAMDTMARAAEDLKKDFRKQ